MICGLWIKGFELAQLFGRRQVILDPQHCCQLNSILNQPQLNYLAQLNSQPLVVSLANPLQWAQRHKAKLLLFNDVGYPEALNSIHHPPAFLWVQGRISLLNEPSIAMVGARKASVSGEALAKQFASSLGASGLTIVSGLAPQLDECLMQRPTLVFSHTKAGPNCPCQSRVHVCKKGIANSMLHSILTTKGTQK